MKKMLLLGLCFMLLAIPTYAREDVNLQQWSSCSIDGYCRTEVDINELSLSKAGKDLLKDIDTDTPYLFESDNVIQDFTIEILDKEKLIITGHITQNTYWTMLIDEVFLDPWWNTTSFDTWTMPSVSWTSHTASAQDYLGTNISLTETITIIAVKKHASSNPYGCHLVDSGENVVGSGSYSGDVCTITGTFSDPYYYLVNNYSSAGQPARYYNSFTYPNASDGGNFQMTACIINDGSWGNCGATQWWDFLEINVTGSGTSLWYETYLYLNGNNTNITLDNATALNSTGTTNLTGLTVLIYINTTLSANNTTTAVNITNLSAGMYNITAWIGNASTNSTLTRWANITYTAPAVVVANYSYTICSDNSTLYEHKAVYNNGSFSYNDTYTLCLNDCDNVSYSCEMPDYQEDFYGFLIVCGFFVGLAVVYKYLRRF